MCFVNVGKSKFYSEGPQDMKVHSHIHHMFQALCWALGQITGFSVTRSPASRLSLLMQDMHVKREHLKPLDVTSGAGRYVQSSRNILKSFGEGSILFVKGGRESGRTSLKSNNYISPVVQCLRIQLPMQGSQVQSLVLEDSACCGAIKPVCYNCLCLESMFCNKRSHCNEKPAHHTEE